MVKERTTQKLAARISEKLCILLRMLLPFPPVSRIPFSKKETTGLALFIFVCFLQSKDTNGSSEQQSNAVLRSSSDGHGGRSRDDRGRGLVSLVATGLGASRRSASGHTAGRHTTGRHTSGDGDEASRLRSIASVARLKKTMLVRVLRRD